MACTHDKYRADNYMMASKALTEIKTGNAGVCWMSQIVSVCDDCGADISHAERVRVMTVKEVMKCVALS